MIVFELKLASLKMAIVFLFASHIMSVCIIVFSLSEALYFLMFDSKVLQEKLLFALGCFNSTAIQIATYYDACIVQPIHSSLAVRNMSMLSLLTFRSNFIVIIHVPLPEKGGGQKLLLQIYDHQRLIFAFPHYSEVWSC